LTKRLVLSSIYNALRVRQSLSLERNRETVFLPDGLLGDALGQSLEGRLRRLAREEPIPVGSLFAPKSKATSFDGDWQGEHVGKWLAAASRAAFRTDDAELIDQIGSVRSGLTECQEPNGYLGTYATLAEPRFTNPDAEGRRTWDVWVHAYVILGLLEAHRHWPHGPSLDACERIAGLLRETFVEKGRDIARYGNHQGLSSLIAIHSLAELTLATGEAKFADTALRLVEQGEALSELQPVRKLLDGQDITTVGTGKAYQLCWLLLGLARLFRATGDDRFWNAAISGWESIHRHHLTLGGGPFGGIGRHREVFNEPGVFDRYGLVETCSSMAWMQLSRELLSQERDPRYAEAIESTLWNSILGAFLPGGEEWCYFIFPNGRRNPTYARACCKSSGPIALEEAALAVCEEDEKGIWLHQLIPGSTELPSGRRAIIAGDMPFGGAARIHLESETALGMVHVRIPSWASGPTIQVAGNLHRPSPGSYCTLHLSEAHQAEIIVEFPMSPSPVWATETLDHHGQEVVRREYLAMQRGPLVYATGPLDGFQIEATLDLRNGFEFVPANPPEGALGPAFHLRRGHSDPILWQPYFEAGGWEPGTWRSTYLGVVRA
jgi:uncharacterized protein